MRAQLATALVGMIGAGCQSTETAARFSFANTPYGFMRLDNQTGETAGLHNGQWVPIEDARYSMDDLIRGGAVGH